MVSSNHYSVFIPDELEISLCIFVFGFSIAVIIEGDFGYIELDEAPQKPVDVGKSLGEIDIVKCFIGICIVAILAGIRHYRYRAGSIMQDPHTHAAQHTSKNCV